MPNASVPSSSTFATLVERFQTALNHSPLWASLRELNQGVEGFSQKGRALTPGEIDQLIAQGNTCEAWSQVRVVASDAAGSLGEIRQSRFEGKVLFTLPAGESTDAQGRVWKNGIRNSLVRNSHIGQACIEGVGRLEQYAVEDEAILAQVEMLTCMKGGSFTLGQIIHPGDETGSRSLWFWDGLDIDTCDLCLRLTPAEQKNFGDLVVTWMRSTSGLPSLASLGRIGRDARILSTRSVQDTWMGDGACIEGAALVRGSALLSSMERPCHIGFDARVVDSMLQAGSEVDAGASVRRSLLLDASGVGESGKVIESVLGPNTHVEKGEITASLAGPFVGFHHQSLLIAALWPEGRGNVAYGANVGSNHTGKKPDQEIRPGEGMFFGLGCTVKFPANFSEAPYSLIASGVTTLPQRLAYPFSLVMEPTFAVTAETSGLNEIRPAFMWSDNLYALARNSFKYAERDKSFGKNLAPQPLEGSPIRDGFFCGRLFAPDIAARVAQAYTWLSEAKPAAGKSLLLPSDLPGLGKNVLRVEWLEKAKEAYAAYLKIFVLRWWAEPTLKANPNLLAHYCGAALAALGLSTETRGANQPAWQLHLAEWRMLLLVLPDAVASSLERDNRRGQAIFDDYSDFHGRADGDKVVQRMREAVKALTALG